MTQFGTVRAGKEGKSSHETPSRCIEASNTHTHTHTLSLFTHRPCGTGTNLSPLRTWLCLQVYIVGKNILAYALHIRRCKLRNKILVCLQVKAAFACQYISLDCRRLRVCFFCSPGGAKDFSRVIYQNGACKKALVCQGLYLSTLSYSDSCQTRVCNSGVSS